MVLQMQKTKERSPNFPFISLETAIRRAQEFYAGEKRGWAPAKIAAKHWSYSASSSGALQTLAALKNYGLMEDEGAGEQRKVRLTELAFRIILDNRSDSSERTSYMRRAALNPQVAAEIYTQWPHNLPSPDTLRHFLVFDRKFGDEFARKVVKIIYENESLTRDAVAAEQSSDKELYEDTYNSSETDPRAMMAPLTQKGPERVATSKTSKIEIISAPDADIQLSFSAEPSFETYDFLEKYVALRKSVLKKAPPANEE